MIFLFNALSWAAILALTFASLPQIFLIFKKKSTRGVSWLTYALLFFGIAILLVRSLFTIDDFLIQLNYALGLFVVLMVNLQFIYYSFIKKRA